MSFIEEEPLHGGSERAAETIALLSGMDIDLRRQFPPDKATVGNALDYLEGYYGLSRMAGLSDSGNSTMRDNANYDVRAYRIRGAAYAAKRGLLQRMGGASVTLE